MLPSNVDDARFAAESEPATASSWLESVLEGVEENGARWPEWLTAFVEAVQRLWA
jgi:hypothetical protein